MSNQEDENKFVHRLVTLCFYNIQNWGHATDADSARMAKQRMGEYIDGCKSDIAGSQHAEEVSDVLNRLRQKIADLHYTKWEILLRVEIKQARERISEILTI